MRVCPVPTGSGESVFTIDTSAEVVTLVPAVAELLALFGSPVEELAVAVFDTAAMRLGSTLSTRVRESEAPFAMSPRFQVTVPADRVPPPEAEMNDVPAGKGSETTAATAVAGPLFVTPMV